MILIKFAASVPSHHLLFIFFFINMILVPGYFLSRFFFARIDLPGRLLLAFIFGTSIIFSILMILALFRLDLFYLGIAVPAMSVILSLGMIRRENDTSDVNVERRWPSAVSRRDQILLLLILLSAGILIIAKGDPMLYTSDSAGQISYIRTVSRTHEAFPEQNLYRDGGILTRDIRKGLMHSAWGAIDLLTGRIDVYEIWPLISLISSVFTILAFFCIGWFIFRSPPVGLIAALIFVFIYGNGLASNKLITTAYSFPIGKTFSMTFLISILCYLRSDRKEWLALMAAASFAGAGTHIGHFFVCAFIIFYVVAGKYIEGPSTERKKLITQTLPLVAAITAGVNFPYLLMRYFRDYAPNNDIHTHLQGIFRISEDLYTLNPVVYFKQTGIIIFLGLLSIFILWKPSRKDGDLRILLWGNIALWLLLFNPVLFPPMLEVISYLVMRLRVAVPVSLLVGMLVKVLWDRMRGRRDLISAKVAVVGWAVLIILTGYQLSVARRSFAYSRDPVRASSFSCLNISELYERINSVVPAQSVVVSDPITSYCIPAFTDQYIVCTNSQHSIPNDSTALERIDECRKIISPLSSLSDIAGVIKKYDVGYIAINGRIPLATGTLYWKPDRWMAGEAITRFEANPMFFELLYREDDIALFRITESFLVEGVNVEDGDSAERYVGGSVPPVELPGLSPSGFSGIYIRSLKADRQSVSRGEKLELEIEWVLERQCEYRSYIVHIRFDTDYNKGALYNDHYGKIYRKIVEKRNNGRFRFRIDHLPFNGIFTPDMWPLFRVIKDKVVVNIPYDIVPGEYMISVRMSESTQYPNYSLKDLLSDDDSFDGPNMARIIVE